jgi:hypothetical protein
MLEKKPHISMISSNTSPWFCDSIQVDVEIKILKILTM